MTVRIWALLIAVLLLAAPADTVFCELEAASEVANEAFVVPVAVALPAATPRKALLIEHATPPPPAPALARVFRPPRGLPS